MGPISMMAWRIGEILDIRQQFVWIQEHGFDGLSFHASAGIPGQWEGIEPDAVGPEMRADLRQSLGAFREIELHAPFSAPLTLGRLETSLPLLEKTLKFAHDVGVDIITVHADVPVDASDRVAWQQAATALDGMAIGEGVCVGLELTSGFDAVQSLGLENVGITLDVGHMYHHDAAPLERVGGDIGALVERLGKHLFHLHLHDVVEGVDHVMPGTGVVDWKGLFTALGAIDYTGMYCLELNPDRVSPEQIVESRDRIAAYAQRA